MIFLDREGKRCHTLIEIPVEDYSLVQMGKDALNSNNNELGLEQKYKDGLRNSSFIYKYVKCLYSSGRKGEAVLLGGNYLLNVSDDTLLSPQGIRLYVWINKGIYSPVFERYLEIERRLVKEYLNEPNIPYFEYECLRTIQQLRDNKSKELYNDIKKRLTEINDSEDDKFLSLLDLYFFEFGTDAWLDAVNKYRKSSFVEAYFLNEVSWDLYKKVENEKLMLFALQLVEEALYLSNEAYIQDTKAHILFKLKRYKEAEETIRLAIEMAESAGRSSPDSEKLLEEMLQLK